MLLIDKILLSPIYATVWAARQIDNTIQQERAAEPERITATLSELYLLLETGRITESEFTARERELLDRLDQLQAEDTDPGPSGEARVQQAGIPEARPARQNRARRARK